jgi:hypothetical protein
MSELIHVEVNMDDVAAGEDREELDAFTRNLLVELRERDVASADLKRGGSAPPGTKAGVELLSAIVLGMTTNAFWDVSKVLLNRLRSRRGVVIKIDGSLGAGQLRFEGTPAEFAKLLEQLSARSDKAANDSA